MHDGYRNTYTFHKDGRQFTLAPFTPQNQANNHRKQALSQPGEFGVLCILKPYFGDDDHANLRANSLQQGEDDVPMGSTKGDQVQRQSNLKGVQEAIQVMRKLKEDQCNCPAVPDSKCSNFASLIT